MGVPVAIIGCGVAGVDMPRSHLEGYCEHPSTSVVALIDTDIAKAKKAESGRWHKHLHSCITTDRISDELEIFPAIVSICTPEESHLSVLRQVLKVWTPLAIFMEKPLATSTAACDWIMSECKIRNITLAINHARAWDSDVRMMARPKLITYGGGPWRNDVHAAHLGVMFGEGGFDMRKVEEPGLWADGKKMWGSLRRNVMAKAISDIIRGVMTGKEPACNGDDARTAVGIIADSLRG